MAAADEEMPGTRPSGVHESGPILGLSELQPDLTGYTMRGSLGSGAMGSVYEATDPSGREVAIKVLHDPQPDEMTRRRFEREVAALRKLEHPGVPEVYDAGQLPDGRLFLVMERLHGINLEDWYDQPGHTRLEALELILDALDALAVAHVRGVVHRDIKPENIFVLADPGYGPKVKLLDFGIALHPAEGEMKRTATGVSVGTPCYMSPEQAARPKLVGAHSDVWSIGVMLYEALSGELPFDGETAHGVVVAICAADHVPLVERSPQTHPALLALVESCLVKPRDDRPINAAELKDSLGPLLKRDDVRATLGGPAATPDLHVMPRPAQPFAETEELTDPEHTDPTRSGRLSDLEVAATVSAQLATPAPAEKSRAPMMLAMVGVALGIVVAVLWVQNMGAPDPVASEAPTVDAVEPDEGADERTDERTAQMDEVDEVEETVDEVEETDEEVVEDRDEEVEEIRVARPRMRPIRNPVVAAQTEMEELAVEAMEPVVVMEEVAMEPVAMVMEPTMQAVTMQATTAQTTTSRRPTRPRMRPTMTRMTGDRPEFVTF